MPASIEISIKLIVCLSDLHHRAVLRTVIYRPSRRPVLGDSRPGRRVVWNLATPNIEGSPNIEGPDIKLFIDVAGQTSISIIFGIDSEMNTRCRSKIS